MTTNFENYSFFRGESTCPFSDEGRCLWWRVESYAVENGDIKISGELSPTMLAYLREHMWQGDAQPDTSETEFKKRAQAMYSRGVWSRSHLTTLGVPFPRG